VLGTLAYIAPEQARGEVDQVDERADVFGLGAVLCVLLTGEPPYLGSGKEDVYRQAVLGKLTDAYARLDRCGADGELVTLARCCLAPDPQERPRHAEEVAEAVAAYQAKVQERLRQAELGRAQAQVKAREERKRRRLALALAGAVLLLLGVVGAAGWWYQQQQAQRAVEQAERDADNARQALRQEQAAGAVQAALGEAMKLRERALTLLDNPESWAATLAAANSAVMRAETLLQQQPQLAETAPKHETQLARTGLEADKKDHRLVTDFEELMFKLYDFDRHYTQIAVYRDVARALAQWGLPVGQLPVARATALLQERPRGMQDRLASILHFCLVWAPATEARQLRWLREVLAATDPDPWRQQFRQAVADADPVALEKLVDKVDVAQQPPAFLVQIARTRLLKGKPGKIALLRRAQWVHPQDFWLNFDLSAALRERFFPGPTARALKAEDLPMVHEVIRFRTAALALRPKNPAVHCNLGVALQDKGDLKGAIACYEKALELDPRLAQAHNNLGLALYARNDLAGAIACFEKALELDPRRSGSHMNLGTALRARGDLAGAIAHFQKALELAPRHSLAHNNLGLLLQKKNDLAGAITHFQKALALDPEYDQACYNLGTALYLNKDLAGAIAAYQKALELDPSSAHTHTGLGVALRAKGDPVRAIACFKKALDVDPNYALAHHHLGLELRARGDLAGAISSWEKAVALDPRYAKAHHNLGLALLDKKEFPAAIASFQKAIALNPQSARAHSGLGAALKAKGDLTGAIASYQKALDLDPKSAKTHHNLGLALHARKDLKGAIASYQKALELDPKYVLAHLHLGNALYDQKDLSGALGHYQKALALDPNNGLVEGARGRALLAAGRFAEARAATRRALDLLPADHPHRRLAEQQLRRCDALLKLDARLAAILKGDAQPRDAAERLALADLCQRFKKRYAAAARFCADAVAAGATLTPQQGYGAACVAVLAAAGKGADADTLDPKERGRLRQQALAWLREALKIHTQKLEGADAKGCAALQQVLQHWQQTVNLDSVRGAKALAQLSEAERAAWQQFWADVAKVHKKAGAKVQP
jgi:tetratricopeptide (TPR) repeat protein